jgi:hypothetical protein
MSDHRLAALHVIRTITGMSPTAFLTVCDDDGLFEICLPLDSCHRRWESHTSKFVEMKQSDEVEIKRKSNEISRSALVLVSEIGNDCDSSRGIFLNLHGTKKHFFFCFLFFFCCAEMQAALD